MTEETNVQALGADQQIIDTLTGMLNDAKTGELTSVMYVVQLKDGDVFHGWAGQPTKTMVGEVEDMKFDLLSQAYFPVEEAYE